MKGGNKSPRLVCTLGILAKFEQNQPLGNLLKSTGDKQLVESCKDREWGTGVPLFVNNSLNPTSWHNQGWLGEILESVRGILLNPPAETSVMPNAMDIETENTAAGMAINAT